MNIYGNNTNNGYNNEIITTWKWLLIQFVLSFVSLIPVVNLIVLYLMYASTSNITLKNYIKAQAVWIAIYMLLLIGGVALAIVMSLIM